MNTQGKKEKIRQLVIDMLNDSREQMEKKADKILSSGAIDIDGWDENVNKMILPKCIITALLESEAHQFSGVGTSFEKQVKREVKNIRYFI